jgi:hypothetical protein
MENKNMKKTLFTVGIIGAMLVFGTLSVSAAETLPKNFATSFNAESAVYGFKQTITINDLLNPVNFAHDQNALVSAEKVERTADSLAITLASTGNLWASLRVEFKTDTATGANYLTRLRFFNRTTGENEDIVYSGTQASLRYINYRYRERMDQFYNSERLAF